MRRERDTWVSNLVSSLNHGFTVTGLGHDSNFESLEVTGPWVTAWVMIEFRGLGKSIKDIFTTNVSKNSKAYRQKKKLISIEKATLRYGASKIINLFAYMKAWFSPINRYFMFKNHKTLLTIPELPDDFNTFILKIEKFLQNNMLEYNSIEHTEVDIIVKTFLYIVDGLNKDFGIH
ncbi:hypothetical protein C2G38_2207389 [Gigaspora rosea]|uniref:Uncharacterized protein n=1 Tax=Gigaspora rosea TaxID=44941 RepID=A0A397UMG6_9GLOM|nr:hypothetical protein C2G38_2207389 [Gigaspora rosea]